MVGYYRLKDFGFTLSRGAHILRREDFEPVEAASALLEAAQARAASVEASAGAAYERERQRGYEEGQAKAQREASSARARCWTPGWPGWKRSFRPSWRLRSAA